MLRVWFIALGILKVHKLASFHGANTTSYRMSAEDWVVIFTVWTLSTSKFLVCTVAHVVNTPRCVKLRARFAMDEALSR